MQTRSDNNAANDPCSLLQRAVSSERRRFEEKAIVTLDKKSHRLSFFGGFSGYGEAIRLLLTYRNVDFEDIRYEHGSFPKEKFEFGRVPGLLRAPCVE